jgi:peroxiredoxin
MAELDRFTLRPGDPAPDFSLPGVDGKSWNLSDFSDAKLLTVMFWCNHCPYVQAWEGRAIELAQRYGAQGVRFVAINSNDDHAYPDDRFEKMVERARTYGYPFPYLRDDSQEVAHAYGALVTPHPLVFDAQRHLVFQGRIDDRHDRPEEVRHRYLADALDAALAGRTVTPPERPVLGCSVKWRA